MWGGAAALEYIWKLLINVGINYATNFDCRQSNQGLKMPKRGKKCTQSEKPPSKDAKQKSDHRPEAKDCLCQWWTSLNVWGQSK